MKELKELQQYLVKLISKTDLKDRKTNVSLSIENGKPYYLAEIMKEDSDWNSQIRSKENSLERCKIRLEFEIKMYSTEEKESSKESNEPLEIMEIM